MVSIDRGLWDVKAEVELVASMAINEAWENKLPGKENGPYDAYRHLLWSAEMTRRLGETTASIVLAGHEFEGDFKGQKVEGKGMDYHNNHIGIQIGKTAVSWDDVVAKCKSAMNQSIAPNSNEPRYGANIPTWLDKGQWEDRSASHGTNWPAPTFLPHAASLESIESKLLDKIPSRKGYYEYDRETNTWEAHTTIPFGMLKTPITDPKRIKELDDIRWHRSSVDSLSEELPKFASNQLNPITKNSSIDDMLDSLYVAAVNKDDKASRAVTHAYLQSDDGQSFIAQGKEFNQQIKANEQQVAFEAQQALNQQLGMDAPVRRGPVIG